MCCGASDFCRIKLQKDRRALLPTGVKPCAIFELCTHNKRGGLHSGHCDFLTSTPNHAAWIFFCSTLTIRQMKNALPPSVFTIVHRLFTRRKTHRFCQRRGRQLENLLDELGQHGLLRLTRTKAKESAPQFSRDGRNLIFASNEDGKFAIYEIELP